MLSGWRLSWSICAAVLFLVVCATVQDELPTREQVMKQWARSLRTSVEQSDPAWDEIGLPRKPGWTETRPEEYGTYADLSDEEVIAAVHERYRTYLGYPSGNTRKVWAQHSPKLYVPISAVVSDTVVASIRRVDAENENALSTLRSDQNRVFASAIFYYLCDRRALIEDALQAHREGRYSLAIPALLPLIDGLAACGESI